ncbi:MAG: hypothetical protein JXA50_03220 [Deltaproteobacteria bacterium]|nr:hypothetical protein [Deltaproteobacteria bacterium]
MTCCGRIQLGDCQLCCNQAVITTIGWRRTINDFCAFELEGNLGTTPSQPRRYSPAFDERISNRPSIGFRREVNVHFQDEFASGQPCTKCVRLDLNRRNFNELNE